MMDRGVRAVSVETQLMTFDEFLKLPDPPGGYYELHHGQVVFMSNPKKPHTRVQKALFDLLYPLLSGLGFLTLEFPFRPEPEHESWRCDIGFATQERLDNDEDDYFMGAPDLVIEVLSPSNTVDEILDRQDICLDNGCIAFWTVDPKRQTVMVTTPDRKTITYDRSSRVPLPEPFQGSIEVAAIFKS